MVVAAWAWASPRRAPCTPPAHTPSSGCPGSGPASPREEAEGRGVGVVVRSTVVTVPRRNTPTSANCDGSSPGCRRRRRRRSEPRAHDGAADGRRAGRAGGVGVQAWVSGVSRGGEGTASGSGGRGVALVNCDSGGSGGGGLRLTLGEMQLPIADGHLADRRRAPTPPTGPSGSPDRREDGTCTAALLAHAAGGFRRVGR